MHLCHVVGVRADSELAGLRVQGKLVKPDQEHHGNYSLYHFLSNLFRHMTIDVLIVLFFYLSKPHWAHDFDQGGLAVQHVLVRVDPESGQLGQDVDHLEGLEVVDEDVGQPEVLDKLHTGGHHHSLRGVGGDHVQPWLVPLHVEVHGDRDAVVLVVDMPHLVDVHGDADHVGLV